MDRPADKVITIKGLLHLRWWGPNNLYDTNVVMWRTIPLISYLCQPKEVLTHIILIIHYFLTLKDKVTFKGNGKPLGHRQQLNALILIFGLCTFHFLDGLSRETSLICSNPCSNCSEYFVILASTFVLGDSDRGFESLSYMMSLNCKNKEKI